MESQSGNTSHRGLHGKSVFIPAGLLIGLGLGLITGYPATGVLVGLGLGLFVTAVVGFQPRSETDTGNCCHRSGRLALGVVGIFLVLVGLAIPWAPFVWAYLWPYGVGGILILLGLWSIVRMYWKEN